MNHQKQTYNLETLLQRKVPLFDETNPQKKDYVQANLLEVEVKFEKFLKGNDDDVGLGLPMDEPCMRLLINANICLCSCSLTDE